MFNRHFTVKSIISVLLICTFAVSSVGAAVLPEKNEDLEFTYNIDMSTYEDGPVTDEHVTDFTNLNLSVITDIYDVYFEDGALVQKITKNMPSGSQCGNINSYYNLIKDGKRKYYEICFSSNLKKQIKFAFACPTGAYNSFMAIDLNTGGNFNMYGNANKKTGTLPATVLNFNPFSEPVKPGEICVIRMLFDTENDEIDGIWWAKESENYTFIKYNPFGDVDSPIGYATYYETESNNRFSKLEIYSTGVGAYAAGDEALRFYYLRTWEDITSKYELAGNELTAEFENLLDVSGTVTGDLELPTVCASYPELEINWVSDNPDIIADDGTVTLPSDNTEVTLNAYIVHADGSYADIEWKIPYKVTVAGTDCEDYIVSHDTFIGDAGLAKWDVSSTGGTAYIDENGLNIEKTEAGTLFTERKFGKGDVDFVLKGKVTFEATMASSGENSQSSIKSSDGTELLKICFENNGDNSMFKYIWKDGEYSNYSNGDIKVKAVFDVDSGTMDLYYKGRRIKKAVPFYGEASDIASFYSLVEGGTLYIKKLTVSIPNENRISMIEKQLEWDKISPDPMENVTYANLFTEAIAGVGIEWNSDIPQIISPDGEVIRGEKSETVNLTAKIFRKENPDIFVEKAFVATVPGIDSGNLAYRKPIMTDLISENDTANLTDGSINSVFASEGREKIGTITVDLGEELPVSSVVLNEIATDGVYAIEGFDVQISSDKTTWKTVYTGSAIGELTTFAFNPEIARYVRDNITDKATRASVKLAEFEVRFDASDSEIAAADAERISYDAEYELTSDIILPTSGIFGSAITWESSNPNIIDNNGKIVEKPLRDTVVTLVATVTKNDAKATKSFRHVVTGQAIGLLPIVGGGSGGGGGGGGGSSSGGSNVVIPVTTPSVESVIPAVNNNTDAFSDLDSVSWAKESIAELKKLGIVSGSGDNKYEPLREVAREEFVKMLLVTVNGEVEDSDSELPFADCVSGEWYQKYISEAFESGLIMGMTNDSFGIGMNITRQDMAVMIARILEKSEIDIATENSPKEFSDGSNIAGYAVSAVNKLSALGILNGDENLRFNPEAAANRAEAAQVMYKLLNVIEESKKEIAETEENVQNEDGQEAENEDIS